MPLYEYECSICDKVFEEFHPMSEATTPRKCPDCPDGMGRRIFSVSNFSEKKLPKGHNLTHSKRRKLWNSDDPKDFKKLM